MINKIIASIFILLLFFVYECKENEIEKLEQKIERDKIKLDIQEYEIKSKKL